MYILGLSGYAHEASCALIKDGQIRVVIEEERFNRKKHTWEYPRQAIEQCLAIEGITINDIDKITFFWVPIKELIGNFKHFLLFFPKSINLLKVPSGGDELSFFSRIKAMQNIAKQIRRQFNLNRPVRIEFIEHHLCHAASAFFVSGFQEAAILTIDGRGESTSTMMSLGQGNKIRKIKEIKVPHSLGYLYAAVTDYLGFRPFFDEWKVMGMSAYGRDTLVKTFEDTIHLTDDGSYRLNLKYFNFHIYGRRSWLGKLFFKNFGPKRNYSDPYEQRHFDVAFALQSTIEKAGIHLAQHLYSITGNSNLCMAGGVILNCLMNKKIVEQTHFKNFFFQPIANDAGTSFGSALYYNHQILNQERNYNFESIFLGNEYSNEEIKRLLDEEKVNYRFSNNIAKDTARFIADGKIVGWFQGRMEAGPRALGNRSIVVSPMDASMKDKLNARVKKREFFRPFAPAILEEKIEEYFRMPKNQLSPYMILVGEVKENKRHLIPAVTHADGTARVQTVSKRLNPRFWQLIAEFEKLTGVPVLLNTSFNENEPIVCSLEDALNCFIRTEFDILAIGDYIVFK